jgi:tetratricopeptide (TPR) repeat protein
MDQGNQWYKNSNYRMAYSLYKQALQKGENQTIARFNMANSLYQLNQTGRALVMYSQLRNDYPDFIRSYINEAGILFSMDQIGDALVIYKKAYGIDANNTTVVKMIGECYLKAGDRAGALEYFEKGSRLEPENTAWYYAMIDVYLSLNDYQSARQLLLQALQANPDRAELFFYLGEVEAMLDLKQEAVNSFTRGLELDPSNGTQYNRLALFHEENESGYLAIMVYQEGMNKKALSTETLLQIARVHQTMGHSQQALNVFREAAAKGIVEARHGVLRIIYQMGLDENWSLYHEALNVADELWPADPDVNELREYFKALK